MKETSKRMLAAGWVLHREDANHWSATSPENRRFSWENGKWSCEEAEILTELEKNEQAIAQGKYSPFTGTSRLVGQNDSEGPGLLIQWLTRQLSVKGTSVIRARTHPDPAGDERLYSAGARRVETLLQPWTQAPDNVRHLPSHLLLCEHVTDVLPKDGREKAVKRLITHLYPDSEAYFLFYQLEALPLELPHTSSGDGYLFTQGPHTLFLKPSLPGQCAPWLENVLGGFAEEMELLYDRIICRWVPHDH